MSLKAQNFSALILKVIADDCSDSNPLRKCQGCLVFVIHLQGSPKLLLLGGIGALWKKFSDKKRKVKTEKLEMDYINIGGGGYIEFFLCVEEF